MALERSGLIPRSSLLELLAAKWQDQSLVAVDALHVLENGVWGVSLSRELLSVTTRNPLTFEDTFGNPLAVDANDIFMVRPALKPVAEGGEQSGEVEKGVVALCLKFQPGVVFVKGDFSATAFHVFGSAVLG